MAEIASPHDETNYIGELSIIYYFYMNMMYLAFARNECTYVESGKIPTTANCNDKRKEAKLENKQVQQRR